MSEENAVPPSPDARQTQVIGERMAIVETKVGGVQDDLRRIGTHIHDISTAVQKITIVEEKCLDGLTTIGKTVGQFESKLEALVADQQGRLAVSDFWRKFAMVITSGAALVAMLGAICAGLIWLAHFLRHMQP